MDNYIKSNVQLTSYDQVYLNELQPKLMALDLYLKENTAPFNIYEIADILEIEPNEITSFMTNQEIDELDIVSLFTFILQCSFGICGYISRQWRYQATRHYTPEIISEIYELNLHKVQSAFDDLNVTFIEQSELIDVFKRIHVTIYK